MIKNEFLIPYQGRYIEVETTAGHVDTISDYYHGLMDKLGWIKASQILGYENQEQVGIAMISR